MAKAKVNGKKIEKITSCKPRVRIQCKDAYINNQGTEMTFNEYKEILEKNGSLDGYAHGLLAAFELGYGQGIVDGKNIQQKEYENSDELTIAYLAGVKKGEQIK